MILTKKKLIGCGKIATFLVCFMMLLCPANVLASPNASSAPSSSKEEAHDYLPMASNGDKVLVGRYQFNYTGNWNYFSNINAVYGYEDEVRRNTYLAGYQNGSGATLTNSSGATGIVKAYLIWETRAPYEQWNESANHVTFLMRDGRTGWS